MNIRRLPTTVVSSLRTDVSVATASQCITELVLNSIDAGATVISVRVDLKNLKLQVVDNGSGILPADLQALGSRYMTSKCQSIDDFNRNLRYYGFRGEALCSIIEVSGTVRIVSRARGSEDSFCKVFSQGVALQVGKSANGLVSCGTTITIADFLYNRPVRRARIKHALDLEDIRKHIECIAVINPSISFTLQDSLTQEVVIQTYKTGDIRKTFQFLFGTELSKSLVPVVETLGSFKLKGYIGKEAYRSNSLQFLYLNKRLLLKTKLHKLVNSIMARSSIIKTNNVPHVPISKEINHSVFLAFSPPRREKHAIFVLNISCPYSEYDITQDPKKTLVEFSNWDEVLSCIERAIRSFIEKEAEPSKGYCESDSCTDKMSSSLLDEINDLARNCVSGYDESETPSCQIGIKTIPTAVHGLPAMRNLVDFSDKTSVDAIPTSNSDHLFCNFSLASRCPSVSYLSETVFTEKSHSKKLNKKERVTHSPKSMNSSFSVSLTDNLYSFDHAEANQSLEEVKSCYVSALRKGFAENRMHFEENFRSFAEWTRLFRKQTPCKSKTPINALADIKEIRRKKLLKNLEKFSFERAYEKPQLLNRTAVKSDEERKLQVEREGFQHLPKCVQSSKAIQTSAYIEGHKHLSKICAGESPSEASIQVDKLQQGHSSSAKKFSSELQQNILDVVDETWSITGTSASSSRNVSLLRENKCRGSDIKAESNVSFKNFQVVDKDFYHGFNQPCSNSFKSVGLQSAIEAQPPNDCFFFVRTNDSITGDSKISLKSPHKTKSYVTDSLPYHGENFSGIAVVKDIIKDCTKDLFDGDLYSECSTPQSVCNLNHDFSSDEEAELPNSQHSTLCENLKTVDQVTAIPQISSKEEEKCTPNKRNYSNYSRIKLVDYSSSASSFSSEDVSKADSLEDECRPCKRRREVNVSNDASFSVTCLQDTEKLNQQENDEKSKDSLKGSSDPCKPPLRNVSHCSFEIDSFDTASLKCKAPLSGSPSSRENKLLVQSPYFNNSTSTTTNTICPKLLSNSCEQVEIRKELFPSSQCNSKNNMKSGAVDTLSIDVDMNVRDSTTTFCQETEWIENKDESGKSFFIHKKSGTTIYTKPQISQVGTFSVKDRSWLLPKGMSPIAKVKSHLEDEIRNSLFSENRDNPPLLESIFKNSDDLSTIKWKNLISDSDHSSWPLLDQLLTEVADSSEVSTKESQISSASFQDLSRPDIKVYNVLYPYTFSKDIFKNLKVIGQLDKKFIVTVVKLDDNEVVVLFDQHAVHERIRVESLTKDYQIKDGNGVWRSAPVEPALPLVLSSIEVRILNSHQKKMNELGLQFDVIDPNTIRIQRVPICLLLRENREIQTRRISVLRQHLESLIREQVDSLLNTRGVGKSQPAVIYNVISSEACRGAIKFGDSLSIADCRALLFNLSLCNLPFQCAHGRPALVPVLDVSKVKKSKSVVKPNLMNLKPYTNIHLVS